MVSELGLHLLATMRNPIPPDRLIV